MAYYDSAPTPAKKRVRKGPDGLPIMEADAAKVPPVGQYAIAATPFPIVQPGERPPPIGYRGTATQPTPPAPVPAMAVDRPAPPQPSFSGMGNVRMAERDMAVNQPQQPDGLAPLPFNDRRSRERDAALRLRTLHSGPNGLDPVKEARIAEIYAAQDRVDANARANRPLQTVQSPGEIANRHSELGRQGADYAKGEVEDAKARMAALTAQIDAGTAPADFADQMAFQQNRLERGMQIMDRFTRDPYWQQYTPEKAGQIQAGQTKLRSRQEADRTNGAADVAAYQSRDQYARNLEDTIRQRGVAEEMAASKAREQQSVAAGEMAKRQGLGTSAEQIATQAAAEDAQQAAEIRRIQRPVETEAAAIDAAKQQHPEWQTAAQGILSGIKSASGKMISGNTRVAYDSMVNAFDTFQNLPPELQKSAAADIMSALAAEGLDVPKSAFQDDKFNNVMSWLMYYTTPQGWAAQALGPTKRTNTRNAQESINSVLASLRETQSQ